MMLPFAAASDVGRVRDGNEDAWGAWPELGVFCVADGMGGAEDGEIASRAVVEAFDRAFADSRPAEAGERGGAAATPHASTLDLEALLDSAERAVAVADRAIRRHAESSGARGCGSTVVAVCFDPDDSRRAMALHVGDSRAYRLRAGRLVQITADHSAAAAAGVKDERRLPPALRGLLLRSVGASDGSPPDRTPFDVESGDRILLCSDGVYRDLSRRDIARVLASAPDAQGAASGLVAAANAAGGSDNATALVVFVDGASVRQSGMERFGGPIRRAISFILRKQS